MNRGRFTWIKISEKHGEGPSRINASGNRYLRNRPAQRREVTQRVELGSSMAGEAGTSYLRVERMSVSMKPSVQAIRSQLPVTERACYWSPPIPVGMNSLNRNDWLVDFGCEPQGSINYFTPRQPDSSRGLEACIPSPHGEHAAGINVSLRTVQLNRLTLQESALPFQVWTTHTMQSYKKPSSREVRVSPC